jgi:hypothetical protein
MSSIDEAVENNNILAEIRLATLSTVMKRSIDSAALLGADSPNAP